MGMNEQRDFYSSEAATYENKRYGSRYGRMFRKLQRAAVTRGMAYSNKPAKALDVATGTGQMLPVLAASGASVVAVDLTEAMLSEARRTAAGIEGIEYRIADAEKLPYPPAEFDVVASSRFLHLFEASKQQHLLLEMARVLKPGGILIVDFYSTDSRRIFAIPVTLYRMLLRKRPENDHRISIGVAGEMLGVAGLQPIFTQGIGNFLLAPLLWLPLPWLVKFGSWMGKNCPKMSEQFLVVARKT